MENKKVSGGWCKTSVVLGVITVIFALLPLASAWFMFLTFFNYVLAPIGIICGIVAIVKSKNKVNYWIAALRSGIMRTIMSG